MVYPPFGIEIFTRNWTFIRGVPSLQFLPPEGPAEIAFAGRSNVGKSSLINSLLDHKGLARTSNTPGRTQELNFFVPSGFSGDGDDLPPIALVDMPGYGFAEAPKSNVDAWTRLVFDYLRGRTTLKRVFILIDSRHGILKKDEEVLTVLDKAAVSYQIVLTKADKLKINALEKQIEAIDAAMLKRAAAFPQLLVTSSQHKTGLESLKQAIINAVAPQ